MRRVAVVTGAVGAIGSCAVAAFVRAGWDVIGVDARGVTGGDHFDGISADVGVAADIERVGEEVERISSRVDCLVHCAAVQVAKPMLETTDEEWDLTLRVNVTAAFRLTRRLLRLLDGGSIINVSSVHAHATSPGMAAYVTSKGALSALTRAMALELAPRGIRVNAVLPGAIESDMLRAGFERGGDAAAARERLVTSTPLRRVGKPSDIAALILFLADADRAAFITGQEFVADGGVSARLASE